MDAPLLRTAFVVITAIGAVTPAGAATFKTPNFTVTAPDAETAELVGKAAEVYRRDLAIFWLESPLPNWSRPCKLRVKPGSLGAGGETKFQFVGGEVINWNMYVQGSLDRILDSVLPHEVNHTIFACHYRRPLPRWADEGAATLFEDRSEQIKQLGLLNMAIKNDREFIPLGRLLKMKEYPKGYRPMLIMYAEGYALADFLVQQGGRQRYLRFLADGEKSGWSAAIKKNYHHGGVESLEKNWRGWILAGRPRLRTPSTDQMLASAKRGPTAETLRPAILDEYSTEQTVRSQSPDTKMTSTSASRRTTTNGPRNSSQSSATGHSRTPSVFRGFPVSAKQSATLTSHRDASFEAPRPVTAPKQNQRRTSQRQPDRSATSRPVRTSTQTTPVGNRQQASTGRDFGRNAFEATGHAVKLKNDPQIQRKHLPQERTLVTGSTPQWAGFPGQTELF